MWSIQVELQNLHTNSNQKHLFLEIQPTLHKHVWITECNCSAHFSKEHVTVVNATVVNVCRCIAMWLLWSSRLSQFTSIQFMLYSTFYIVATQLSRKWMFLKEQIRIRKCYDENIIKLFNMHYVPNLKELCKSFFVLSRRTFNMYLDNLHCWIIDSLSEMNPESVCFERINQTFINHLLICVNFSRSLTHDVGIMYCLSIRKLN